MFNVAYIVRRILTLNLLLQSVYVHKRVATPRHLQLDCFYRIIIWLIHFLSIADPSNRKAQQLLQPKNRRYKGRGLQKCTQSLFMGNFWGAKYLKEGRTK